MALYMTPAAKRLSERTLEIEERLKVLANGRGIDPQQPQWTWPDGRTEPLSRQDRELVIRWQFLVQGFATVRDMGLRVTSESAGALAAAYLQLDDEIGPVFIIMSGEKNEILFADGDSHVLTSKEKAAIDRFLRAVDTFNEEIRRSGL